MELLSHDLEDLMHRTRTSRFTPKTGLMIGLQLVDRIEALHRIGYLHRDVKPENLGIGLKENTKIIYLFDFGICKRIGDPHPPEEKGKMVGTLAFMSCASHEGKLAGPADDLESFVYTILYLINGNLPWLSLKITGPKDMHKVLLMKSNLSQSSVKRAPKELFEILRYVRSLKRKDEPDYLKIKYKLIEALK